MPMSKGNTFKSHTLISNLSNNLTAENSQKPLKNASNLPSTLQKKKSNARGLTDKNKMKTEMKGGPTTRTRPNAKAILGHTSEDEETPNYLDVMSYD